MSLSKQYKQTYSFPIEFINTPIDKKITNNKIILNTTIEESGWDLIGKHIKKRTIKIDLKKYNTSNNIQFTDLKSFVSEQFKDLNIISISPSKLILNIEKLVVKKIPVRLNFQTNFPDNFYFHKETKISPDSILISSDSTTLNFINFIETEEFKITEIDSFQANIKLQIPNDIKTTIKKVSAKFNIEEFAEKEFEVLIYIENKPKNKDLIFYPEKIKVKTLVPFSKYEKITASNFYISADFNNIDVSKDKTINLSIKEQPKNVKHIQLEKDFIEFVLYSK